MIRNDRFLLREVADTLVLVPIGEAAGAFYGMVTLNGTGAFIWEQLAREHTVQSLAEALAAQYAVDLAQAQKDVEDFIEKLLPTGAILKN